MFSSIPPDLLRHIISLSGDTLKTVSLCRGVCKNWREALSVKAIKEFSDGIKYVEFIDVTLKNLNKYKYFLGFRTQYVFLEPFHYNDLRHFQIQIINWCSKSCPNLKEFKVYNGDFNDSLILELVKSFPYLSSIWIGNSSIITNESLVALARCRNLKKLVFGFDSRKCSDNGFKMICQACSNLEQLFFFGRNYFTNESLREISKLKNLETLHSYKLPEQALIEIARGCPKLKRVHCEMSDVSLLEFIQWCPEIVILDTIFTDVSLTAVANAYPNLEELELYEESRVSDASLSQVFQKCPKLKVFCFNRHEGKGGVPPFIVDLQTSFEYLERCQNLEYISIENCRMPKDSYISISKLKNLRVLDIYNCDNFDDSCYIKIVTECKKLRIIRSDLPTTNLMQECRDLHPNIKFLGGTWW